MSSPPRRRTFRPTRRHFAPARLLLPANSPGAAGTELAIFPGMKLTATWTDNLQFRATAEGHTVNMDTKPPLGKDTAPTPKQLLLAAACGCTGMDVAALMRKYRQPMTGLEIEAEGKVREGAYPAVFESLELTFRFTGEIEAEKALEAVRLSQTRYCAVSGMLAKAMPITYTVHLNSAPIGSGRAHFDEGEQK